jgi:hypothetical protein
MSLDFHSVRGKIIFLMLAATIVLALVRKRRWATGRACLPAPRLLCGHDL